MLAKFLASWLVVLAVLPFTAPFSTFKLGDLLGSRPSKRCASEIVTSVVAAEIAETDLATNPTTKDVRPVAAAHGDTRLMPAVVPAALAVDSAIDRRRRLILAEQDPESAPTRPLIVLRR